MRGRLQGGSRVVILSGAGLSRASGVPTFRDGDGLWRGHRMTDVATPDAWLRDASMVREFYDERRVAAAAVLPNPGHDALSRLQHSLGRSRVTLVTQNIDGLIQKAGAIEVLEMHGSLWTLKCEASDEHPRVGVYGRQDPDGRCAICGHRLRPDVVWFGELPVHVERIGGELAECDLFVSVGTSGVVYPAAGFVQVARAAGARCIEVNPKPSGGDFDEVIAEGSEVALPRLVAEWLGEEAPLEP